VTFVDMQLLKRGKESTLFRGVSFDWGKVDALQ